MKKFNIEDYKGKYAMLCENIKQAKIFCEYLDSVGRRWKNGDCYVAQLEYLINNECFFQGVFYLDKPSWDNCKEAVPPGYQILNFSDFDWEETKPFARRSCLEDAINIVCKDRENTYGKAEDNFALIAEYWEMYLGFKGITAHDVAMMMLLLKIARIQTGKFKADNYIDLAGYAACAGEIGGKENE